MTITLRRNRPKCVEEMAKMSSKTKSPPTELIARFEKKIQAALARVWGEET
jgi:hypothetical protein